MQQCSETLRTVLSYQRIVDGVRDFYEGALFLIQMSMFRTHSTMFLNLTAFHGKQETLGPHIFCSSVHDLLQM